MLKYAMFSPPTMGILNLAKVQFARHQYVLYSILLHLFILITFNLYFHFLKKPTIHGSASLQTLSAFIYQENPQSSPDTQEKKITPKVTKEVIKKSHPDTMAIKKVVDKVIDEPTQHVAQQSSASQGESVATLVAMLHDAIQRKQQYPTSALEMQRQGRVTVAFSLFEDGHITQLRMLASSGTSSLDRAALQAVNDAAPFTKLSPYIQTPGEYKVEIVFELP